MSPLANRVLVVFGSTFAGVVAFASSFFFVDFLWVHFVIGDRGEVSPADGVVVIGGGFILGLFVGVATAVFALVRFWPRTAVK